MTLFFILQLSWFHWLMASRSCRLVVSWRMTRCVCVCVCVCVSLCVFEVVESKVSEFAPQKRNVRGRASVSDHSSLSVHFFLILNVFIKHELIA